MKCAYGIEGDLLMHQKVAESPQLDHVPTLVLNGNYDTGVEEDIRNSVKEFICRQGQNAGRTDCKTTY
jgi:hypothetical protein